MADPTPEIQRHLERVSDLRAERRADVRFSDHVAAIKRFQQARFERDYADLLASSRHGPAARFFLSDLYGPTDFAERDAQFGRVIPAVKRLLPAEVMHIVAALAWLHALSEDLDQHMARALGAESVDERSYRAAWRTVGRSDDRKQQLDLLLEIGTALDRQTRSALLATTLRLMRGPAKAAGLAELQSFLERGLAAFTAMRGADEFLDVVSKNERRLIADMFFQPKK